jgi:hypothetical protein
MKNYGGQEADIDALLAQQEADRKAKQASSVYRTIDPGKAARLDLTLKVFTRMAQFQNGTSLKLGAELAEKTPEGKNKVFEVGSTSKAARDITRIVKAAKTAGKTHVEILVSRTGDGNDTRYAITEIEG